MVFQRSVFLVVPFSEELCEEKVYPKRIFAIERQDMWVNVKSTQKLVIYAGNLKDFFGDL